MNQNIQSDKRVSVSWCIRMSDYHSNLLYFCQVWATFEQLRSTKLDSDNMSIQKTPIPIKLVVIVLFSTKF